ncbi:MAG: hypothetical protein AAFR59_05155, partial [Bacteroidota bacterium]
DVIHPEQQNLQLKVYACALANQNLEVWLDGEKLGTVKNIKKPWGWYGSNLFLRGIARGSHSITFKVPQDIYLDKIQLTTR